MFLLLIITGVIYNTVLFHMGVYAVIYYFVKFF